MYINFLNIPVLPILLIQNVIPMFFGNKKTSIIKYFKELGYITNYAQNQCNRYIFDPNKNYYSYSFETFEHEFISLFCDPNYSHPEVYSSFLN